MISHSFYVCSQRYDEQYERHFIRYFETNRKIFTRCTFNGHIVMVLCIHKHISIHSNDGGCTVRVCLYACEWIWMYTCGRFCQKKCLHPNRQNGNGIWWPRFFIATLQHHEYRSFARYGYIHFIRMGEKLHPTNNPHCFYVCVCVCVSV